MKFKLPNLAITLLCLLVTANLAHAQDQYDNLRAKWRLVLTGGTGYNTGDPKVAATLARITTTASGYSSSMIPPPSGEDTRTFLWEDLDDYDEEGDLLPANDRTARITSSYNRLKAMALAYSTDGSTLENNAALLAKIRDGLDWLRLKKYNRVPATMWGNEWDWKIGVPMAYNDIMVLLYAQLYGSSQWTDYLDAVDEFSVDTTYSPGSSTAANRVWRCTVVALYGILAKDSTRMALAKTDFEDPNNEVFNYVTFSDGVYADGSIIQHTGHPYTGGYGTVLIYYGAELMGLLDGSTWEITSTTSQRIFDWVYNSYEPLIYKGMIFDSVMGRNMSVFSTNDHLASHKVMAAILRLSEFATTTNAAAYKSMVKHWIQTDTTVYNFFADASMEMTLKANALLANSSVVPRGELSKFKLYYGMDRVSHQRPGFAFGISMYSDRIFNYESHLGQNLKGWHMGSGMTYLYNADLLQYSDAFWPTVDQKRLPGTTVLKNTSVDSDGQDSNQAWVGGTDGAGLYGVVGMQYRQHAKNLYAKKSWFMFDDEIVALGAGITDSVETTIPVETIVENRQLNSTGSNVFTVNGTSQSPALVTTPTTLTAVNWAHLAGNVASSDIGYYFPVPATLQSLRSARTANWASIDTRNNNTVMHTRNYLNFWFDHGAAPTNATYAYVLLPGKNSGDVLNYAGSPDVTVLENSTAAQGVKENGLNVTGVNFWADAVKTVGIITSNKKASIMTVETAGEIEVSVSDPTRQNTGTIAVEIDKAASGTVSASSGITVTQLSPTIKFTVNVNGAKGKTFKARFDLSAPAGTLLAETFDAGTTGSAPAGWTNTTSGGTVTVQAVPSTTNKSLRMLDNSSSAEVTTKKSFAAANGTIVAEFRAKAMQTSSVSGFSLRDSAGTAAVTVAFNSNGYLYTYDGTTVENIQTYAADTWYGFIIVADPSTDKFDLYFDNGTGYSLLSSGNSFRNAVTNLAEVYINTYGPAGTSYFDDILVQNALLSERFNSGITGSAPAGWTNTTAGGTVTVADVPSTSDKSMRVLDNSSTAFVTTKKTFTATTGMVIAEFKAKVMQTTGISGFSLRDSAGTTAVTVAFNSNGYLYTYDGATVENIQTYTADVWYAFRIIADPASDRFALYLDTGSGYTLVSSQNNFRSPVANLSEVYINTYNPTGTSYYDNIAVY